MHERNFWLGLSLLGIGLLDAAVDPLTGVTAPQLFTAGIALMVAAQSGGKG